VTPIAPAHFRRVHDPLFGNPPLSFMGDGLRAAADPYSR
jgi:hypothetical protein